MKNLTLILMAILTLNNPSYGQPPLASLSNLHKIMEKVKMDEGDKYIINEAAQLRKEAKKLLEDASLIMNEWVELKNLEFATSHFDDLKKKAEKKKIKTECRILNMQAEALETYELYNDILHAFYQKQHKSIFPDVDVVTIAEGNRMMKEAEVIWENAKSIRDKGYSAEQGRKMIEDLIKAQRQEEEALLMQEQALALLLSFTPSEGQKIPYALLEMPKGVSTTKSGNDEKLLAINNDGKTSVVPDLTSPENEKVFDDNCEEQGHSIVAYKIQIGAFLGKANEAAFRGITPITTEKSETGFTRYLAGDYHNFEVAKHALDILRNTGFSDAFIVVYTDNLRMGPAPAQNAQKATAGK